MTKRLVRGTVCIMAITGVFASCQKNDDAKQGSPVNNSYLASVRTTTAEASVVDSFRYDSQHRVTWYGLQISGSSGGGSYSDSTRIDFDLSAGTGLPTGYQYLHNDDMPDVHTLSFDGQGRITRDTSISTNRVSDFFYTGNYIICKTRYDGTDDDVQIDTLTIQNGDIVSEKVWIKNPGANWDNNGEIRLSHGKAANPGYKAEIARSIGPLLWVLSTNTYGGYSDYISKTVVTKVAGSVVGIPASGVDYTIGIDGAGRVASMKLAGSGLPVVASSAFIYY